jgi:hypothetical protein
MIGSSRSPVTAQGHAPSRKIRQTELAIVDWDIFSALLEFVDINGCDNFEKVQTFSNSFIRYYISALILRMFGHGLGSL